MKYQTGDAITGIQGEYIVIKANSVWLWVLNKYGTIMIWRNCDKLERDILQYEKRNF